jgi:intracellular sulfur oxidation DsrE/DsrF family protein
MTKLINGLALLVAGIALAVSWLALERADGPVKSIADLTQQAPPAAHIPAVQPAQPAAPEADLVKVVYHVDYADPRRYSAMLTSINNMVTTFQNDLADYDVRIVFVAHGIRFVTDDPLVDTPFAEDAALAESRSELKGRLLSLKDVQGVKLELCDITRQGIGLDAELLYPDVELVRSGVVRLSELQRDGFAYLKIE